jgi:hypothetical protein
MKVLLIASLPPLFCVGCAALLTYRERKQWIWFAGLSILYGGGALAILNMIQLPQLVSASTLDISTSRRRHPTGIPHAPAWLGGGGDSRRMKTPGRRK